MYSGTEVSYDIIVLILVRMGIDPVLGTEKDGGSRRGSIRIGLDRSGDIERILIK